MRDPQAELSAQVLRKLQDLFHRHEGDALRYASTSDPDIKATTPRTALNWLVPDPKDPKSEIANHSHAATMLRMLNEELPTIATFLATETWPDVVAKLTLMLQATSKPYTDSADDVTLSKYAVEISGTAKLTDLTGTWVIAPERSTNEVWLGFTFAGDRLVWVDFVVGLDEDSDEDEDGDEDEDEDGDENENGDEAARRGSQHKFVLVTAAQLSKAKCDDGDDGDDTE